MAKAPPFISITINITRKDLVEVAETVTEYLTEQFSGEVFEAAGLNIIGLREEILDLPAFAQMVEKGIKKYGVEAIVDPWDYMDFTEVECSKEWLGMIKMFDELTEIIDEINEEEIERQFVPKDDDCADAIRTLKAAGYRIVKD